MLDLRQLQTLVAVNQTGSYTAAAEMLGYTQPAVSYQMRQLQREAGTTLVVQAGRGVQLTQAGKALAIHAQSVFAALHAAREEMAALAEHGGAVVRMEAFQSSCATLIPRAAIWLGHEGAMPRIVVHQAEPVEARARIRCGDADIGVLANWDSEPLPDGEESMRRVELMTERRCVVMRRDHPLAQEPEIDFTALAGEPWVMESARDRFAAACRHYGFTPKIAAEADDQVTIQALVVAGLGITLTNELAQHAYLATGLIARPLRDWPRRRIYALLWPDMASVPAVAAVLRAVQAAAREALDRRCCG